ncbi:Putative capsular polysaccharide biosynthesis protein [Croceitalea dokdonensis DOKDO 023]|uniref:Putative capsular polysaccharide biosynthesis protein n=1 Tax=Croceitalea dokdonensis DOKDO 023 TaxID=1300341 RepID=A0A0P7AR10_9FLAO|nr:polysaccharide biosynthesis protein [Croceitalea dokdonensis]KPM30197.1 Putative capsular polysaccharide biosynthesis protein [Croceitalea dokdonensis DOKDO 023]
MSQSAHKQDKLFPLGLVFLLDVLLTAFSFVVSYALCSLILPDINSHKMLLQLPIVVAISSMIFLFIGIYKGFVKTDRLREVYSIFNAICLANVLTIVLIVINGKLIMEKDLMVPLSIIVVHSILSFTALVASRWLYKRIIFHLKKTYKHATNAILFVNGALDEGTQKRMKELFAEHSMDLDRIVSIKTELDAFKPKAGKNHGLILVSKDAAKNHQQFHGLVSKMAKTSIPIKIVDKDTNELSNTDTMSALAVKPYTLSDLFPSQLTFDLGAYNTKLTGKTILITGAGGCIGSAFSKELYRSGIKATLILLDHSESALNRIYGFMSNSSMLTCVPKLVDVKDKKSLQEIFSKYDPDYVLHAAGNNVPESLDSQTNKVIQENVMATKLVADVAQAHKVERFVFCSSSEAVLPRTTLEVCKRLSEIYLETLHVGKEGMKVFSVRLPRVFESDSSATKYIENQIRFDKPIDRALFFEEETFCNAVDVAKVLVMVFSESTLNLNEGTLQLSVGVQTQISQLAKAIYHHLTISGANQGTTLKFENEFKFKTAGVTKTTTGEIEALPITSIASSETGRSRTEIQQKIENICLNVLFGNDDYSPIFDLVDTFGDGQWQNLYKLHLESKTPNKIIKLQSH